MPPTGPARETAVALHCWLPITIAVLTAAVGLAGCEQKVEQPPNVRPVRTVTVDTRTAGTPIVLTGRSFGTTNLVLLDADGNAIADERVLVSIDEGNTVRVFKQTERSVLSCTPNCEQHAEFSTATKTP